MNYQDVERLLKRRIHPTSGAVEYFVKWKALPAFEGTWEPRHLLLEHCSDMVLAVDQECIGQSDSAIASWRCSHGLTSSRRKKRERGREGSPERLTAVVRRGKEADTALLLGEVVLEDGASAVISNLSTSHSRKGNPRKQSSFDRLCGVSAEASKAWKLKWGQGAPLAGVHHDSVQQPLTPHFITAPEGSNAEEDTIEEDGIEIIDITLPDGTVSGGPYITPHSFVPLIGIEGSETLRRQCIALHPHAAPHINQLLYRKYDRVVRYGVVNPVTHKTEIMAMPLSVFRMTYPQTLLSFLLESSILIESP